MNQTTIDAFVKERGIVRSKAIYEAGYPRVAISRAVKEGSIKKLSRGLYCSPDQPLSEWTDLAELCTKIPNAVLSLVSALAFHEIGTQIPHEHWISLPTGTRTPMFHQPLRITRFSEPYYSLSVETHQVDGVPVRVYSPAKTVVDCFKNRSKVGHDVAIEALKDGLALKKFTPGEIGEIAKICRMDSVMWPYLEALTS